MKKKYLKIANLKTADDNFKYNLDKYCQLVAKKYGQDQKYVKEYIKKFFEFLESKNLLEDRDKIINKNIKTLIIDRENKNIEATVEGLYSSKDNLIKIKPIFKYNKNHVLIHEFVHMLTSTSKSVDKNSMSFVSGDINQIEEIGFMACENSYNKPKYNTYEINLNKQEFINLLIKKCNFMPAAFLNVINSGKNLILNKSLSCISKLFNDNKFILSQALNIIEKDKNLEEKSKQNKKLNIKLQNLQKEKVEIINTFVKTNFNKPKRMFLFLSENYNLEINFDGNNFYTKIYEISELVENNIQYFDNNTLNLNEGMTELLATMFDTYLNKQDMLFSSGYTLNTKYCELLYRIYGDNLLKTFFNRSIEELQYLIQLEDDEMNEFLDNIEMLYEPGLNKEELQNLHVKIMDTILFCFENHVIKDIIENLDIFANSREIEVSIEKAILDFASSSYSGHKKSCIFEMKDIVNSQFVASYTNCIVQLLIYANELAKSGEISEENFQKLLTIKGKDENQQKILKSKINYIVENNYYFINNNLDQINPTDFVRGRKIKVHDQNKRDYLRKKSKFPTTFDIEKN